MLDSTPTLINHMENVELNKEVEEKDILEATWDLETNKASRMGGFSIYFYRKLWSLTKIDLWKMIKWYLNKDKLGGSTNSYFLAPISK